MPGPVSSNTATNQCIDPQLSLEDDGAGGASNIGYEGGARGAGNAAPARPLEKPDDRCDHEAFTAVLACTLLVRRFDLLLLAKCADAASDLVMCVSNRIDNPKP